MPELLDNPGANYLIQYDDRSVELVPKSDMNRLVFEHGLWGLLRTGDDILVVKPDGEKPRIRVVPETSAQAYSLHVGDYDPIHLGPHQKADLVDALMEGKCEDGNLRRSLIRLYDTARDVSVRERIIGVIAEHEPFASNVEVVKDGWLIHQHLLLTWDREFYHPGTMSKTRSGHIIGNGSTEKAYQVNMRKKPDPDGMRSLSVDGHDYRLSDDEMDFITRAMWAIAAAPSGR